MKYSISLLCLLFFFTNSAFAQNDVQVTLEYDEVVDTIITFHPETYEETVQIIRRKVKSGQPVIPNGDLNMQSDTIIYFDKDTYEERIVVVNRKGNNNQGSIDPMINSVGMQIDTVITFDPKTKKETMQIIRKKN